MRRVHLRGHTTIRKRVLIHAGGFNLGLLMRQLIGVGTPRGLQGRLNAVLATLVALLRPLWELVTGHRRPVHRISPIEHPAIAESAVVHLSAREMVFTTGCWQEVTMKVQFCRERTGTTGVGVSGPPCSAA